MVRLGKPLRLIQEQTKTKAGKPCRFEGCERHAVAKGLCSPHRKQELRGLPLMPIRGERAECAFEGCERRVNSKGLCMTHARQRWRGIELKPIHVPTYRYEHGGYVRVRDPSHPNADKNGNVLEHVKVMSELLGRPLFPGENVHHKNGVKDNNRPENLELWVTSQPKGQRVPDLVAWAHEILERYDNTIS
jgi:hypothetical protein